MKRQILFRGLRKDGKGWIYGDLRQVNDFTYISTNNTRGIEDKVSTLEPVIEDSVCQYTEIQDKNGNKIFEGDIILIKGRKCVVEWNKLYTYYSIYPLDNITSSMIIEMFENSQLGNGYPLRKDLEIIGNIHED